MFGRTISRRNVLKLLTAGLGYTVLAACAPAATPAPAPTAAPKQEEAKATAAPAATEVPKATEAPKAAGWTGKIEFYAQSYTPSEVLINPDPNAPKRKMMQTLADEWMDSHPGIELVYVNAPSENYPQWIQTQLVGGVGPDIFWIWLGTLNNFADQEQTVILNDYLNLPNKYAPEDGPWKTTFFDPFLTSYSVKGNWGGVPMDLVSTGMYTNKDLMKEAGVDMDAIINKDLGSPESWAVFMDMCKKVKDIGKIACSPTMGIVNQWWTLGVMSDQLLWPWLDTMDLLNYYETIPMEKQKGAISQEEVVMEWICNKRNLLEDPAQQDMFRIMKEWTPYFPEGFTLPDYGQPYDLFMKGELAMMWDGSWQIGRIQQDERRNFEVTSFWLPPITKETSQYVRDPVQLPIGVGGYGSLSYGINIKCVKKGNVDACVDYLMWLTTPEHDEAVVNEVPSFIPSNKKAKALPEVQNLFVGESRLMASGHPLINLYSWFGWQENKWGDTCRREMELFLTDNQDQKTLTDNLTKAAEDTWPAMVRSAAKQYDEKGNWDLTKWTCQPSV